MRNCLYAVALLAVLLPASMLAQTDTVNVTDFFDSGGTEGTLNLKVDSVVAAGTLSNVVFKLKPYGLYVLSATIRVPAGKRMTIVAPDPGLTQQTAPPMICWTPSTGVSTTFNFDCFGDIHMKNIWILYATTNTTPPGTQVGSALEIDQDTTDNVNIGTFENVIFDYAPISNGGGAVTVSAAHAQLSFQNCYFRNLTDTHFRYYSRAVSFPFGTAGWHIDAVKFENCTFANMGYTYMQEGGEYADTVSFNHCTFMNTIMYTLESGWWRWCSVTNSVYVNPYMFGYIRSNDGATPYGGALNIDSISTFGFTPPFTESERHILFANNSYFVEKWLRDYMAPYNVSTNPTGGNAYSNGAFAINPDSIPVPQPMMSAKTLAFFNDKASWPYIKMANLYDSTNPGFFVPPTNEIGIKSFLLRKWTDNSDTTWAFDPGSDITQSWPINENLSYNNNTLKTAGMGGFPLGDIYRWWGTTKYNQWKAQASTERAAINALMTTTGVAQGQAPMPAEFTLSQNYPNPFNPTTEIKYSVPQKSILSLKVYNLLGQEVATLFTGERQPGTYAVTFDGTQFSSGVYFYQLEGNRVSITKKLVLMK